MSKTPLPPASSSSSSSLEAVVEKLLVDIKDENTSYIKHTLSNDKDKPMWLSALRYEMSIITLIDHLLDSDIILPRLVVCGVRTIAPLHYAALRGTDNILSEFKVTKISPNVPLSGGSTPLQFACFAGNLSTVKLLLNEWKADLKQKDGYGWSPLHYASIGGQLEIVEELCRRGVNIMDRDQDGTTSAYRAQMFGHEAIVEFFKSIWIGESKELFEVRQEVLGSHSNETSTDDPYSITSKQKPQQHSNTDKNINNNNNNNNNSSSSNNEAKTFLIENIYDIPDDLVTRIQCKYDPSNGLYDNPGESQNNKIHKNVYDLPYDPQREESAKKIQDLVKSQLREVFESDDTYLQEKSRSGGAYETIGRDHNIPNIGFKTLKYLLRNEFKKYKDAGQSIGRPISSEDGLKSDGSGSGNVGFVEERNIYEEIVKNSDKESKWVKGGQTIKLKSNNTPPALPPRQSIFNEMTFKQTENIQKPRDSYNKEFHRASTCLNQIEQTQLVREVCFSELLPVLGPGDWQKLALALPLRQNSFLSQEKIRSIEKQFPKDQKRQAKAALQDWNKHFGKNATLENLVIAMKKCGFVEKIKAVEAANKKA